VDATIARLEADLRRGQKLATTDAIGHATATVSSSRSADLRCARRHISKETNVCGQDVTPMCADAPDEWPHG
jgi:hypothetical protein